MRLTTTGGRGGEIDWKISMHAGGAKGEYDAVAEAYVDLGAGEVRLGTVIIEHVSTPADMAAKLFPALEKFCLSLPGRSIPTGAD